MNTNENTYRRILRCYDSLFQAVRDCGGNPKFISQMLKEPLEDFIVKVAGPNGIEFRYGVEVAPLSGTVIVGTKETLKPGDAVYMGTALTHPSDDGNVKIALNGDVQKMNETERHNCLGPHAQTGRVYTKPDDYYYDDGYVDDDYGTCGDPYP